MGKKNLTKTGEQRERLRVFFQDYQGDWLREDIIKVSQAIGLSRQQVYKWLWDRKKAERLRVKIQSRDESLSANSYEFVPIYHQNYKIYVPNNKQQALLFEVRPEVSMLTIQILRNEGWQLVRDTPSDFYRILEKSQFFDEEVEHMILIPSRSKLPSKSRMEAENRVSEFHVLKDLEKKEEIYESES